MILFEILTGIYLILLVFLPFQDYEFAKLLVLAMSAMTALAFLMKRFESASISTLFFHFAVIFYYAVRATGFDGSMRNWFLASALIQWFVVLWLAISNSNRKGSVFLMIALISPVYVTMLNAWSRSVPGIAIFCLLALHALSFDKLVELRRLKLPWLPVAFLILLVIGIPFSLYPGKNLEFFFINCVCAIAYIIVSKKERAPVLAGYLFLTLIFFALAFHKEFYVFRYVGFEAFRVRLGVVVRHNDLVPILILSCAILLDYYFHIRTKWLRNVILAAITSLTLLLLLTYSRNGYAAWFLGAFFIFFARKEMRKASLIIPVAAIGTMIGILLWISPVRQTIQDRILDRPSAVTRLLTLKSGINSIAAHPFFGTGWMTFYTHARYPAALSLQKSLNPTQNDLPLQTHSTLLDLSEAGGIPLTIVFLFFMLSHFKALRRNVVLCGGLLGTFYLCIADSAPFWLFFYPHLWILLGRIRSRLPGPTQGVRLHWAIIPLIGLFAAIAPLSADYFMQKGSFRFVNGEIRTAEQNYFAARFLLPFDVGPLEGLRDVYLAEGNVEKAKSNLRQCISVKKDFSPYYAQLARIYLGERNYTESERYLNMAQRLDPYARLGGGTYQSLAQLAWERKNRKLFEQSVSLSALLNQHGVSPHLVGKALSLVDEGTLIRIVNHFADTNASTISEWSTVMDHFRLNLQSIGKSDASIRVLQLVLQKLDGAPERERDYFYLALIDQYSVRQEWNEIRALKSRLTNGLASLLQARLDIVDGDLESARKRLMMATKQYDYYDLRNVWSTYLHRTGNFGSLRGQYEILKAISVEAPNQFWRHEIARSYFADGQYKSAAEEYHRLTFLSYSDPAFHWWEARSWWRAGEKTKAQIANDRAQQMMQSNKFYESFYKHAPAQSGIFRLGIPNRFDGVLWRATINLHPPMQVVLPYPVRLLKADFALAPEVWSRDTNGVTFWVKDTKGNVLSSQLIDPRSNPNHQKWNRLEWRSDAGALQIILEVTDNGSPNYDWTVLSIEDIQ